jgi:exonuclease VII small subunit
MSAPVDRILAVLEGVRRSGPGWRANCPIGHKSRGTLAIAEADTGGVLLHCHAGCAAADIVAAVGLELSDLYPPRERIEQSAADRRENRERLALAGLRAAAELLAVEGHVLDDALRMQARGETLSAEDAERLRTARKRIAGACAALAREVRP